MGFQHQLPGRTWLCITLKIVYEIELYLFNSSRPNDAYIIGLWNGLSPIQCHSIYWTNAATLNWTLGNKQTNSPDVTIKMQHFPFTNVGMRVKMSSVKWWTFKYIYMLTHCGLTTPYGDIGLGQHCLTAPNQKYLNRYWLLISYLIWHSPENNFTSTAWATIRYN